MQVKKFLYMLFYVKTIVLKTRRLAEDTFEVAEVAHYLSESFMGISFLFSPIHLPKRKKAP